MQSVLSGDEFQEEGLGDMSLCVCSMSSPKAIRASWWGKSGCIILRVFLWHGSSWSEGFCSTVRLMCHRGHVYSIAHLTAVLRNDSKSLLQPGTGPYPLEHTQPVESLAGLGIDIVHVLLPSQVIRDSSTQDLGRLILCTSLPAVVSSGTPLMWRGGPSWEGYHHVLSFFQQWAASLLPRPFISLIHSVL